MSAHVYPMRALIPDYLRAGGGLAVTGGPLLLAEPAPLMGYVLAALALLFAVFGARTALRHLTRFELSDDGLAARGPMKVTVHWHDLDEVELRYFSTRRDRGQGWMQLRLRGAGDAIRLDSAISEFARIAARAGSEAEARGARLSETTRANLASLGASAPSALGAAAMP